MWNVEMLLGVFCFSGAHYWDAVSWSMVKVKVKVSVCRSSADADQVSQRQNNCPVLCAGAWRAGMTARDGLGWDIGTEYLIIVRLRTGDGGRPTSVLWRAPLLTRFESP